MRAPRWMKLSKGKVVGDRLEITVTAPYCPCGRDAERAAEVDALFSGLGR